MMFAVNSFKDVVASIEAAAKTIVDELKNSNNMNSKELSISEFEDGYKFLELFSKIVDGFTVKRKDSGVIVVSYNYETFELTPSYSNGMVTMKCVQTSEPITDEEKRKQRARFDAIYNWKPIPEWAK